LHALLDPHETRPDAATIRVTRAASRGAAC
jgi:hypothetical protein